MVSVNITFCAAAAAVDRNLLDFIGHLDINPIHS